ncbi:hypothetical protein [Halorussus salinus]|uniref:hypothetical protein n=1 Tax=Halorussus salinus TaxID=1364935 RepID=UPI001092A559|nr:hypothetical protein [Halorussus salinus]
MTGPSRDDGSSLGSDDSASTGELDVPTLRTLGRRAASHPLVASWELRPTSSSPRELELRFDASGYPRAVDDVRLDVHWFTTDDYYFHYVETRGDDRYQCRWDRHPKTDAPRAHFHPPPDAGTAMESPLGTHHLDVLFTVLDWIRERVESLHSRD